MKTEAYTRERPFRIGDRVFHPASGRTGRITSLTEFDSNAMVLWDADQPDDIYCTAYHPSGPHALHRIVTA